MSPQAFRQQLELTILELEKCDDLCQLIRQNRRLGSTTAALDNFQSDLLQSASKIDSKFKTYRTLIGSRMDLGDDLARSEITHSIQVLKLTIQQRLSEIAYGHRGDRRDPEVPGFRKLLERWTKIHYDITSTIEQLAFRLEHKPSSSTSSTTSSTTTSSTTTRPSSTTRPSTTSTRLDSQGKPIRPDEIIIKSKQLDELVEQMRNCWTEKEVGGQILYVNAFDTKKTTWERPSGGFIKAVRHVRYEEPESRWRESRGW